jgi:hypothetical protein
MSMASEHRSGGGVEQPFADPQARVPTHRPLDR